MNIVNKLVNDIFLRKILQGKALFSAKIYTAGIFLTFLPVAAVVTNFNSVFDLYLTEREVYTEQKYPRTQMPTKALFRMVGVFGDCVWHYVQVQLNDSEWHIGTQPVSQRLVDCFCIFISVCFFPVVFFVCFFMSNVLGLPFSLPFLYLFVCLILFMGFILCSSPAQ